MTDRPILFSGPMIRALLAGTKTQTRRLLKPEPTTNSAGLLIWERAGVFVQGTPDDVAFVQRVKKGDLLWVREAYSGPYHMTGIPPRDWRADLPIWLWADGNPDDGDWTKPKPGMHMPRWASRLTLTVTDVRVERLQDISEDDALAEGIIKLDRKAWLGGGPLYGLHEGEGHDTAVGAYNRLWRDINGDGSWAANPWIVAYTFTVHHGNIDRIAA